MNPKFFLPGMVYAFSGEIDDSTYQLTSGLERGICFAPDVRNTTGWILCDGSEVKISLFPDLFYVIGNLYGGDEPQRVFQVPNYQGYFLRGLLPEEGEDADDPANEDRTPSKNPIVQPNGVGSTQKNMVQAHRHKYEKTDTGIPISFTSGDGPPIQENPAFTEGLFKPDAEEDLSGTETRPKNIYVHYLIFAGKKGWVQ